jgi:hypothetical protein
VRACEPRSAHKRHLRYLRKRASPASPLLVSALAIRCNWVYTLVAGGTPVRRTSFVLTAINAVLAVRAAGIPVAGQPATGPYDSPAGY